MLVCSIFCFYSLGCLRVLREQFECIFVVFVGLWLLWLMHSFVHWYQYYCFGGECIIFGLCHISYVFCLILLVLFNSSGFVGSLYVIVFADN